MPIKRKTVKAEDNGSLLNIDMRPNAEVFMEEISTLSSAAVGVVVVRTRELQRAAAALFEFAISKGNTKFRTWMITDGWKEIPTNSRAQQVSALGGAFAIGGDNPDNEAAPEFICDLYPENSKGDEAMEINSAMYSFFEHTQKDFNDGVVASVNVMFAPDFFFENPGFQEHLRHAVSQSLDRDARLYLICHDSAEIPERLFEEVKVLDFDAPNANELYHAIDEILQNSEIDGDAEFDIELSEHDKFRIVQNGLGLSSSEFATALSIGVVKQEDAIQSGDAPDVDVLVKTILDSKLEMIKKNPILEYKSPVPMEDVGGLGKLKDWIRKRKRAFSPEAAAFGVDKPRGVLAAGIPGSGKSLIAKAISSVLGIPCVMLDIGKVFGSLVGQSEAQMRTALKIVEAMAPCVLFVDEVDKAFGGMTGGGDSGTSSRVFGTFLTWLQERDNDTRPIMVVFTGNNVNQLPPELMRKGRVDEIFCVSFPSKTERKEIFKIHGRLRGHEFDDAMLEEVARATHEFVGAEIESVVAEAILTAFDEEEEAVTSEILVRCAATVRPIAKTFPERIAAMNAWARQNAVPASDSYDFGDVAVSGEDAKPKVSAKRLAGRGSRIIKPGRSSNG